MNARLPDAITEPQRSTPVYTRCQILVVGMRASNCITRSYVTSALDRPND